MELNLPQKPIRKPDTKDPTPPTLKAQLKIHKPGIPIRPVVNNRTAPAYKDTKKTKQYPTTLPSRKPIHSRKLHQTSQRPN
jgi:hypothetical protein